MVRNCRNLEIKSYKYWKFYQIYFRKEAPIYQIIIHYQLMPSCYLFNIPLPDICLTVCDITISGIKMWSR